METINLHIKFSPPSYIEGKTDIPAEQFRYEENKIIYNYLVDRISKQLSTDKYFIRTYNQWRGGFPGDRMDVYFIFPLSYFPQGCEKVLEKESWKFVKIDDDKVLYKNVDYGILKHLEFGICDLLMQEGKKGVKRIFKNELTIIKRIDFKEVYEIMLEKAISYIKKKMDNIKRQ